MWCCLRLATWSWSTLAFLSGYLPEPTTSKVFTALPCPRPRPMMQKLVCSAQVAPTCGRWRSRSPVSSCAVCAAITNRNFVSVLICSWNVNIAPECTICFATHSIRAQACELLFLANWGSSEHSRACGVAHTFAAPCTGSSCKETVQISFFLFPNMWICHTPSLRITWFIYLFAALWRSSWTWHATPSCHTGTPKTCSQSMRFFLQIICVLLSCSIIPVYRRCV